MKVYIYPASNKSADLIHETLELLQQVESDYDMQATIENCDIYIDPTLAFGKDDIVPNFSFGNGVSSGSGNYVLLKDGRKPKCCWIVLPIMRDDLINTMKAIV